MSSTDPADALARALLASFPADAARELERFSGADAASVLGGVDVAVAAPVVNALSTPIARDVLSALPAPEAAAIAAALPAPWVAALLRGAPRSGSSAILAAMPPAARTAVDRAMASRPGTAGALVEPAVLSLASDVDAAFALEQARTRTVTARDRVYVVDRSGKLVGVVGVAGLVVAEPTAALSSLMVTNVVTVERDADTEAIATHPGWTSWRTLPVVDRGGVLQGVVRYETVQRLLLDRPPVQTNAMALPVSLAELFWIGMTGITDGLARSVTATMERRDD